MRAAPTEQTSDYQAYHKTLRLSEQLVHPGGWWRNLSATPLAFLHKNLFTALTTYVRHLEEVLQTDREKTVAWLSVSTGGFVLASQPCPSFLVFLGNPLFRSFSIPVSTAVMRNVSNT